MFHTYHEEYQRIKIEYFSGITIADLQSGKPRKRHRI